MRFLMSISGDIKRLIVDINGFPIGRRVGGYLMMLIGFILFISSAALCVIVLWGLVEGLLEGSLPPYIDPEDSEWDIR